MFSDSTQKKYWMFKNELELKQHRGKANSDFMERNTHKISSLSSPEKLNYFLNEEEERILIREYDENVAIDLLKTIIRSGINYIDTAPYYGVSEIFLGKALKEIPRNAYYISTKVGRYSAGFDYSERRVHESLNRSLQRLNLDYVDFLIIHDIEFADDLSVIIDETIPAVRKLITEGKVKFFGLSSYPINPLMEVINQSLDKPDFILTYARNTLIDNTLQDYLPQLQEKNIGIINAGCLSLGLLSSSGPQPWHPAQDSVKLMCRHAADYCQKKGVELGRLALHHSFNLPGPTTCLVGMGSLSCFEENLDVSYNGLSDLEMEVLSYLKKKFFVPGLVCHWEGIEVDAYQKKKRQQVLKNK